MTEEGDVGVQAAGALDALLLATKLSIPPVGRGAVQRTALITRARTSACRVIGVSAPAGYGKTTLLSEWALSEQRAVAWVSLDRLDDDPRVLLALLAAAYVRVAPGSPDLIAEIGGLGISTLGRAAPRLAAALRASPISFVLMLDDLHELQSTACHDVLSVVISGIPEGSQLVAASRADQPHLPPLRASGAAMELLADDLALDVTGAEQIFAQSNVTLTTEQAAHVTARTEGWPVGLYLASLIARDSRGVDLTISGDDRYVADYLYREALQRLLGGDQRFLRWTAVLDQLCAPLCEAVVGERGARRRLDRLESSRLFLVPLDRHRRWYRYHGLFREFLLAELHRVEPEVITKLHLRAADWYESSGSPAMAVEHLLQTSERERCVRLVTELTLPSFEAGQLSTVQRWLATLGDPAIEEYPPLAVLAGWIAIYNGQTADAQRWAAIADAGAYELTPLDGSASFDSARAMLRAMLCPAGPEQMLTDAQFAVAQEPPWSPWRDTALTLCAEAHLLTGDVDQATALFTEASAVSAAVGNTEPRVVCEAELAWSAMDDSRWEEAAEHLDVAVAGIEHRQLHDYPTAVLAFAGAARLAVHRGDLDGANRQLTLAMRARPSLTFVMPTFAVRARLHLAKVHWAIAEQRAARHLLHEIDDILLRRPALGVLVDEAARLRAQLTSHSDLGATGGSPLTPAELRVLPYLQTHLTIGGIAERFYVSRNTVNSQVASIYRKLGASSRDDAVRRATAVGLLGG